MRCEACGRTVRSNNLRAVFLFWRPNDQPAMVCNQRCLARYNEGDDVKPGDAMSDTAATYKPGDHLPTGQEVLEVDEKGRPLVVGPKPKKAKAEATAGSVEVPAPAPEPAPEPAPAPKPKRTPKPKSEAGPPELTKLLNAPLQKASKAKAKKPKSEKSVNTSAVAEKVAAAKAPEPAQPATETKEESVPAKKKSKAKGKAPKAAKKVTGRGRRWTDELKAKCRSQIKAGTATYASIAKDMGVTAQTVWASLNRESK